MPDQLQIKNQGAAELISGLPLGQSNRAGDETRTRDLLLGKEVFYQLNYAREKQYHYTTTPQTCNPAVLCYNQSEEETVWIAGRGAGSRC